MTTTSLLSISLLSLTLSPLLMTSTCSGSRDERKEEQISAQIQESDSIPDSVVYNSIRGNTSMSQISSGPNRVVLTGLPKHRLITIYKSNDKNKLNGEGYYEQSRHTYYEEDNELDQHFMPGLDLIYGFNLLNIAHYDLAAEKINYLFDHPVLIKSVYYPSFVQDSLDNEPINRNYYFVSVYDTDTNADTLINKKDLRNFYYFNAEGKQQIKIVPDHYSVVRSQYDPQNDIMYLFTRHDTNKNGLIDKEEPVQIFWVNLKQPAEAKLLY